MILIEQSASRPKASALASELGVADGFEVGEAMDDQQVGPSVRERQPAIRDRPSAAEPYVVESGIPRASSKGCGLEVEPARACSPYAARIIHRDRGALRNADFDLLTVVSPN